MADEEEYVQVLKECEARARGDILLQGQHAWADK
jgi:hypothetical protein